MLIEVNQCNVLKDNKISYNVKTYRVTPQKVQYIVNLFIQTPYPLDFYLFHWQTDFFLSVEDE